MTITDLLKVRDLYHAALENLPHVVATAIGRYRFRASDSLFWDFRKPGPARTLFNSKVTERSWPSILVFVKKWVDNTQSFAHPWEIVPQYLYLPDGRAVPTCVILIDFDQSPQAGLSSNDIHYPENYMGGGVGIYSSVQGEEHVGTVACLVTNGENCYALTAKHVAGPEGQKIFTRHRGEPVEIGVSDSVQAKITRFDELYPGYPGEHSLATIDAGLVRLHDLSFWTSQVLNLGELTEIKNVSPHNLSLDIIGTPVRAIGAVSKDRIKGEIAALFPRYRNVGGTDYLADLLISAISKAPDDFRVNRGDSGALFVINSNSEEKEHFIPLALNWGAMDLISEGRPYQFAFASFLSSICKKLDIELINGHNAGLHPVWGKQNHQTIAEIVVELAKARKNIPCQLMVNQKEFLPQLAVMPDDWKMQNKRNKNIEGPNHYANVDLEDNNIKLKDVTPFSAKSWFEFYETYKKEHPKIKYGALPFRVGDVFEAMVAFRRSGDLRGFAGAAGILTHYIADACNPAHSSRFGLGNPDKIDTSYHSIWDSWSSEGKSSAAEIKGLLKDRKPISPITDRSGAEKAALDLQCKTLTRVDPADHIDLEDPSKARKLAREFCRSEKGHEAWALCVSDCCELLLALWESAWKVGEKDGKVIKTKEINSFRLTVDDMEYFLNEDTWVPSRDLKIISGDQSGNNH